MLTQKLSARQIRNQRALYKKTRNKVD